MITVAITRRVRAGREAEFEARIREFFRDSLAEEGNLGASLIRPIEDEERQSYGILRTFADKAARDRFYASDAFARWGEAVEPLVEGEPQRRELHGLEAFFRHDAAGAPPAWKMAVVTWFAVNPAVYLSSLLVRSTVGQPPMVVDLLLVNALVVAALTWLLMPPLTRLFSGFLNPVNHN